MPHPAKRLGGGKPKVQKPFICLNYDHNILLLRESVKHELDKPLNNC